MGTDRYDRTLGRIWLGNRDVRELVAEGYEWAYRDYLTDMTLLEDEKLARDEGLGAPCLSSDQQRLRRNLGADSHGVIWQETRRMLPYSDMESSSECILALHG